MRCRHESRGETHFCGREIGRLGHEVRLIAPAHVKPFAKRQKKDGADAEAICEAALRPSMRFVPVKSEATRVAAMVFRVRERTQAIKPCAATWPSSGRWCCKVPPTTGVWWLW